MSNAIQLFTSLGSSRQSAQAAQSSAGLWFARAWSFNGYAMGWTRWQRIEPPTHPETLDNPADMIESYGAPAARVLSPEERSRTIMTKHGAMTLASNAGLRLRLPDSPEEAEAKAIDKACGIKTRRAAEGACPKRRLSL